MTVYVDDMEAPFGKMKMCHMIADTRAELDAMADRIGVARKWRQKSGTAGEHYDICMSKRRLAVGQGAVELTTYELACRTFARRKAPGARDLYFGAPVEQPTQHRRQRSWSGLLRVVSGGQSGADRGGLDAAMALGIPIGGWVPLGRRAEDGAVPAHYVGLRETNTEDYRARTALNVEMAGATVVFYHDQPTAGSAFTVACCAGAKRPWLEIRLRGCRYAEEAPKISRLIVENKVRVLNVAGSSERKAPGIAADVRGVLMLALSPWQTSA